MIEVLEFVFAGFWRFVKCAILLGLVGKILILCVAVARGAVVKDEP